MRFFAHVLDSGGVLRQPELLPSVGHGPQHRNKGSGGGDGNPLAHSVFDEIGIGVQSRGQELVAGNEHHHEIQRTRDTHAVTLPGKVVHLGAQRTGVRIQMASADSPSAAFWAAR